MKYSVIFESESSSFSSRPDMVQWYESKKDIKEAFREWIQTHEIMGTSGSYAIAYVVIGKLDNMANVYPDFLIKLGKRGGVVFHAC